MITDIDVKKLIKEFKKVFATKEDIKSLDKNIERIPKNLEEKTDKIILELGTDIGNVMKEVQDLKDELRAGRIILGEQEARMQRLEKKYLNL